MGAVLFPARVTGAEARVVEATAEYFQYLADPDPVGRTGQDVPAVLAPRTLDESSPAQETQEFGHVVDRESFGLADLRNRQAGAIASAGELEQAAQAVFLLGAEFHGRALGSHYPQL